MGIGIKLGETWDWEREWEWTIWNGREWYWKQHSRPSLLYSHHYSANTVIVVTCVWVKSTPIIH